MRCCAGCFGDRGLRKDIFPFRSVEIGDCPYCISNNVALLPPENLADYFQLLISAYRPDPKGRLLVHWFRDDWGLFEHERMDDPRAKDLLAEILDDGDIVRQMFMPAEAGSGDPLGDWQKLRDELMYQNRFFPELEVDFDRLGELLSHLKISPDEVPTMWHRARIQAGDSPFA